MRCLVTSLDDLGSRKGLLVRLSNEKLKENVARINRFEATFREAISSTAASEAHDSSGASVFIGGGSLVVDNSGADGREALALRGVVATTGSHSRVVVAVYGERLHKRKREWLVEWADTRNPTAPPTLSCPAAGAGEGATPEAAAAADAAAANKAAVKSWENFAAIGLQAPLIAFEEKRTGLQDTLCSWDAPPAHPETAAGTIVDAGDGHSVYYCVQDDTVKSVATSNGLLLQQLYEQNSGRYGLAKFKLTSKLPSLTQLRLPKKCPLLPSLSGE